MHLISAQNIISRNHLNPPAYCPAPLSTSTNHSRHLHTGELNDYCCCASAHQCFLASAWCCCGFCGTPRSSSSMLSSLPSAFSSSTSLCLLFSSSCKASSFVGISNMPSSSSSSPALSPRSLCSS